MVRSIQAALERRKRTSSVYLYQVARAIGMSEERLRRILKGRVKNVADKEYTSIADEMGIDEQQLRREIADVCQVHRAEQARET